MDDRLHSMLETSFDDAVDVGRLRASTDLRVRQVARRRRAVAGAAAAAVVVAAAIVAPPLIDQWRQPDPTVELDPAAPPPAEGPTDDEGADAQHGEDAVAGEWRALPEAPVEGRQNAGVVWSGEELLVWGGVPRSGGAAYDPAADTWRLLPDAPLDPREDHVAVWTGEELVVWGGLAYDEPDDPTAPVELLNDFRADGAAYDPAADTWRPLAPSPLAPRAGAAAVWTGTEVLIASGTGGGPDEGTFDDFTDAAAYDPASDTWRELPKLPSPGLREVGRDAVWTGDEMLVGGSRFEPGVAAAYDPDADAWRLIEGSPLAGAGGFVAWTGNVAILTDTMNGALAAYDPDANAWRDLPTPPVDSLQLSALSYVAVGDRLVALGGLDGDPDDPMGAWMLDAAGGTWTALDEPPIPDRGRPAAVWAGEQVLTWSGIVDPEVSEGRAAHHDGAAWRPPGAGG